VDAHVAVPHACRRPEAVAEATVDGRARVLIVDDHALLRDAIRVALELAGHEVIGEAGDGYEAIRLAEELHPPVVLMDVSLPGLDGIEATRRLSARGSEARVVILTMHGDPALVARAVRAGASAYDLVIDWLGWCRTGSSPNHDDGSEEHQA